MERAYEEFYSTFYLSLLSLSSFLSLSLALFPSFLFFFLICYPAVEMFDSRSGIDSPRAHKSAIFLHTEGLKPIFRLQSRKVPILRFNPLWRYGNHFLVKESYRFHMSKVYRAKSNRFLSSPFIFYVSFKIERYDDSYNTIPKIYIKISRYAMLDLS